MNNFSIVSGISILDIKNNPDEFNKWRKMKYSMTSVVQRLVSSGKYSESEYDNARSIIGRSNLEELEKLNEMKDVLKAGTLKLDEWLALAEDANHKDRSVVKVTKRSKPIKISEPRVVADPEVKKLKEEKAKTVRLIKSHFKKGMLEQDVVDERVEHVNGLEDACDVVKYRNSIKLVRKQGSRKKHIPPPKEEEDVSDDEVSDELVGSEESD